MFSVNHSLSISVPHSGSYVIAIVTLFFSYVQQLFVCVCSTTNCVCVCSTSIFMCVCSKTILMYVCSMTIFVCVCSAFFLVCVLNNCACVCICNFFLVFINYPCLSFEIFSCVIIHQLSVCVYFISIHIHYVSVLLTEPNLFVCSI